MVFHNVHNCQITNVEQLNMSTVLQLNNDNLSFYLKKLEKEEQVEEIIKTNRNLKNQNKKTGKSMKQKKLL